MVPSLTSEVAADENNEINYKTISFRAIGGNYSVQYPSNLPFSFGFALLRLNKCLQEHFYNHNETSDKYLFQVFTANSDGETIVSHKLWPRISTRYVRFSALSWHNHISMRVELYGCANEP